jgi:hypothetical protein
MREGKSSSVNNNLAVDRLAHNPKVGGFKSTPATNLFNQLQAISVVSPAYVALTLPAVAQQPCPCPGRFRSLTAWVIRIESGAAVGVPEQFAGRITIRVERCGPARGLVSQSRYWSWF